MPRTISIIVYRLLVMMLLLSYAPQCPSLAVGRSRTLQDPSQSGAQAAAEKAFKQGLELSAQRSPEALRKAIEKYEEALLLFRSIGDHRSESKVLYVLGLTYAAVGEQQKAIGFYNQALPLVRAIG